MRTEETIKIENDMFRKTMISSPKHRICFTEMVADLKDEDREELIGLIRNFNDFNEDNDPYGHHDFGMIEMKGQKYYFKIDYYDDSWEYGEDPLEKKPNRLMVIMNSKEY